MPPDAIRLTIEVREELFHFIHYQDWSDHAQKRFRNHGHTPRTAICVDAAGAVCTRGGQFKAAVYPVRVYAVDDPPYLPGEPQTMTGEPENAR